MTDHKSGNHIEGGDLTIPVRTDVANHMKHLRFSGKTVSHLAAFVLQIMTQLCNINPAVLMWVPISTNPIVMDAGGRV